MSKKHLIWVQKNQYQGQNRRDLAEKQHEGKKKIMAQLTVCFNAANGNPQKKRKK